MNCAVNVFLHLETFKLFQFLHLSPRRTLRLVLFNDGTFARNSVEKYQQIMRNFSDFEKNHLKRDGSEPLGLNPVGLNLVGSEHLVALETEMGGFKPMGFQISATDSKIVDKLRSLLADLPALKEINVTTILDKGTDPVGPDLEKIQKNEGIPGISLHSENFELMENFLRTFWNSKGDFLTQLDAENLDHALVSWAVLVFFLQILTKFQNWRRKIKNFKI